MRQKLQKWVDEKFGEILAQDVFNMKEDVVADKEGNRIRQITMFVKKRKGIRQIWLKNEVFEQWTKELKEIIGDNVLKLHIFSTEGNELRYMGGEMKEGDKKEYKEIMANYYNYQFNLVLWKKV